MTFFLPGLMGNASRISSIAADLVLQWRLGDEGVSFRFTPPGGSLQRATEINPSAYQQLRPGSGVEVETVPQCPWICRLAQW